MAPVLHDRVDPALAEGVPGGTSSIGPCRRGNPVCSEQVLGDGERRPASRPRTGPRGSPRWRPRRSRRRPACSCRRRRSRRARAARRAAVTARPRVRTRMSWLVLLFITCGREVDDGGSPSSARSVAGTVHVGCVTRSSIRPSRRSRTGHQAGRQSPMGDAEHDVVAERASADQAADDDDGEDAGRRPG